MESLFAKLVAERGVFKDERVLLPDYLPDILPHREKEIREIALALRTGAEGIKPENVVILGAPGSGKTSCVKYVFRELANYSQRVIPIYINCWEITTRHGILSKIASSLGRFVPRRGIAIDEVIERIVGVVSREKKIPIVALDEIDKLFIAPKREEEVLYDLVRADEVFSVSFGVIGITNTKEFLYKVEQRVRSSLAQNQIEFNQYSPEQLKDILYERAKKAFFDGVLANEVIPVCAAHSAKKGGDARLAINLLWKAGRVAEKEGVAQIELHHLHTAIAEGAEVSESLVPIEKSIIEVLKRRGEVTTKELYAELKAKKTDRTIRNHILRLKVLGIIEEEWVKGKKGRTRKVKLRG